ncbi:MAG: hypothetical protein KF887_17360 [Paracoccaceae bacterium]|nr:MAG: hypothetical protein KF887_17360 [Paracoccaceae bacterium]
MADDLPEISLGYIESGAPAVYVDVTPVESARHLSDAAPWLCTPGGALLCAQAVNHLAHAQTYTVIDDPARFAEWYRKRYAAEPPGKVSPEGGYGLRNFGMPDLASITAPMIADDLLVFFAVNRQIGAPYRVTATLSALDAPEYDPVPMTAGD